MINHFLEPVDSGKETLFQRDTSSPSDHLKCRSKVGNSHLLEFSIQIHIEVQSQIWTNNVSNFFHQFSD